MGGILVLVFIAVKYLGVERLRSFSAFLSSKKCKSAIKLL